MVYRLSYGHFVFLLVVRVLSCFTMVACLDSLSPQLLSPLVLSCFKVRWSSEHRLLCHGSPGLVTCCFSPRPFRARYRRTHRLGGRVCNRAYTLSYIYTRIHTRLLSLSLYAQATCEIQLYTAGVGWCVFRLYAIGSLRDFTAASLVGAWKNVSCSDGPLPTYGSSSK